MNKNGFPTSAGGEYSVTHSSVTTFMASRQILMLRMVSRRDRGSRAGEGSSDRGSLHRRQRSHAHASEEPRNDPKSNEQTSNLRQLVVHPKNHKEQSNECTPHGRLVTRLRLAGVWLGFRSSRLPMALFIVTANSVFFRNS